MSKAKPALFLVLLVLGSIFLQSFRVQAEASSPLVHIEPQQTETLLVDDKFTVYVWVDNADGVEGAQVQFTYDPTVLNVTQVVEGSFLQMPGPNPGTIIGQLYAEEDLGSVPPTGKVFYSAAISYGSTKFLTGASGSGTLLNVTFRVLSEGASQFHLVPYRQAFLPGHGIIEEGVFFQNLEFVNTYPSLKDGFYGTPVSLSVSPDVINVGESATLKGRVTGTAAGSVTSVNLEYVEEGGNWTVLAALPTDESGNFTYQFTGNKTGDYEFRIFFTLAGKYVQSLVAVVTVEDISSHFYYVYYILAALILIIGAAVVVHFIRMKRRPEEFPLPS
jgi:hypothetical protein